MAISYKPLFRLMLERDMRKTDLKAAAGLSPTVISKLGKNQCVSMDNLQKLCGVFGCQFSDIVEYIPDDKA